MPPLTKKQIAAKTYRQTHQAQITTYQRGYYATHTAEKHAYYVAHQETYLAAALEARIAAGQSLPPGQYLAHCRQWQLLTHLPHTCVLCGCRFFEETPHA